jgi:succinyl-diaminopimelate desuccinylase
MQAGILRDMIDHKATAKYREEIARDLSELLKIPSVQGEAAPGAPFGAETKRALDYVLARGKALGFTVKNVDGYAGHVEYGSSGPLIAVLVHLDVVPAGDGWKHDPFGGEREDDVIYGRGASDNKGPAVAALYVLRAFADQIRKPSARIRVIFGTNEESGMECMKYYFAHEELPACGFSPDSGYPLYNREMGIVNALLEAPRKGRRLVSSLSGGEALNMVANEARAVVLGDYADRAEAIVEAMNTVSVERRLSARRSADGLLIEAKGISAHGGRPANGVSAIAYLIAAIDAIAEAVEEETAAARSERISDNAVRVTRRIHSADDAVEPQIRTLARLVGYETRGDSLGVACRDKESGELSVNWGTVEVTDTVVKSGLNIRYPVTADYAAICGALSGRTSREGFTTIYDHHLPPLFIPEDDPFIRKLLAAYRAVTGEEAKPLSMAGGTYARMLENRGVAFGANFAGDAYNVHQPEEHVRLDGLLRHAEISLRALYELSEGTDPE